MHCAALAIHAAPTNLYLLLSTIGYSMLGVFMPAVLSMPVPKHLILLRPSSDVLHYIDTHSRPVPVPFNCSLTPLLRKLTISSYQFP